MTSPMEPAVPASRVEQGVERTSLAQILLIIRRRWRLLAIVWVVTVAAVAVYTFTTKRLYRPQASLEIRPEMPLVSADSQDPALMAIREGQTGRSASVAARRRLEGMGVRLIGAVLNCAGSTSDSYGYYYYSYSCKSQSDRHSRH